MGVAMIPEELVRDLDELKERGYIFETVENSGRIYVIFSGYPLPTGIYNMDKTSLLIFTTPLYPNAGFDMFWVEENCTLKNNTIPKNGDAIENHLGKRWRRFSYHPYNAKAWNPSQDNVVSFMGYVDLRLRRGD